MPDPTPPTPPTPPPPAAPPAIDYGAVYGTLSAENKELFEKKGFGKAGEGGKPADINMIFDWGRNAEKMVGEDRIRSPRLDDDKEFDKWEGHEKLGVPKNEKEYKFERPQMPEGVEYDEAAENVLRVALSKARIGQKQATRIYGELVAMRTGEAARAVAKVKEERDGMESELRRDFGAGYDANLTRAKMALSFVADKAKVDVKAAIDGLAKSVGNAAAIKMLNWIGGQLGEDAIKGGAQAGFASGPAAAKAELSRLKTDEGFNKAYYTATHPGHKDAVERMARLNEQAAQG